MARLSNEKAPDMTETKKLADRLRDVANNGTDTIHPVKLIGLLTLASDELVRLDALINNPHTDDFLEAVRLEAAHQQERWGTSHDTGKTDPDWFWLVGHLAGKVILKPEKDLHHIITTAAALLNWHAHKSGSNTRMRPGIAPPGGEK